MSKPKKDLGSGCQRLLLRWLTWVGKSRSPRRLQMALEPSRDPSWEAPEQAEDTNQASQQGHTAAAWVGAAFRNPRLLVVREPGVLDRLYQSPITQNQTETPRYLNYFCCLGNTALMQVHSRMPVSALFTVTPFFFGTSRGPSVPRLTGGSPGKGPAGVCGCYVELICCSTVRRNTSITCHVTRNTQHHVFLRGLGKVTLPVPQVHLASATSWQCQVGTQKVTYCRYLRSPAMGIS